MIYCEDCKYLSVKEREQTSKKEHHVCQKYNKRVLHMGHHPEIVRLPECDEPVSEDRHLTQRAPDSFTAGEISQPEIVVVENALPAVSG